jgi:hypothetical protein
MPSRTSTVVAIPILLAALLTAGAAAAQQPGPSDAVSCVGEGAIVNGERQPPTPAEVKARETSPACQSQEAGVPSVDSSPKAGRELDQIYSKLLRIERHQSPEDQDPGAAGQ